MILRFIPEEDTHGPWTFVLYFADKIEHTVTFDAWQAQKTVSANGQVVTLVSYPFNMFLPAKQAYNIGKLKSVSINCVRFYWSLIGHN